MRRPLIPVLFLAIGVGAAGAQAAAGMIFQGTAGPDRLIGTPRADELYGHGGNDRLDGRGANDLIDGGAGRDRLAGSAGADRLSSSGDGRADAVQCGNGRDLVEADLGDSVAPDCEVVSRQLSRDADLGSEGQHETQVEPDSFAFGSTVVTVFQSGRYVEGGAAGIGFATSRNAGRSWRAGLLPGVSVFSGPFFAVSDPAIAYDRIHRWWLAASLGESSGTSSLVVSRSRDGVSWAMPVTVASSTAEEYDKEWIVCDNWRSSRFRGRCYLSYMNFARDQIETRRSTNGGRTWSRPAVIAVNRSPAVVNGVQPVVRPNGSLVLVFAVFGSPIPGANEIAAARSTDGGATFTQPTRVSTLEDAEPSGMRAPPFPTVDVDRSGRIYVAWSDCRFSEQCTADIAFVRSRDGITWPAPVRVPVAEQDASLDHFLPGLAVDPTTSGARTRVALLFHTLKPEASCVPGCLVVDVGLIVSRDAGSTWSQSERLNAISMPPVWMADTSLGRMLGDYVSVSWTEGRPVPVFVLASEPSRGLFHQATFATTRYTPPAAAARRRR